MDKFIIEGGRKLKGRVRIHGAKNSALPIMAAAILGSGETELLDVPTIRDVRTMCEMLRRFGAELDVTDSSIKIRPDNIIHTEAPYEIIKTMRASFIVMGPLLSRFGRARVARPGGCAIGSRPVDLHIKGFQKLGAKIDIVHGYVEAKCRKLKGDRIYLDFPSVGATENLMIAACLAEGETVIENAAKEPEVIDLADFLGKMGADVEGAGSDVIRIQGGRMLTGVRHRVIPDRIEAGTFMVAAAAAGGDVTIENIKAEHLEAVYSKLQEAGINLSWNGDSVRIKGGRRPKPIDIKSLPYPGFPTDLQAPIMTLLTVASGTSVVTETIFENRFMHVPELVRMGADASIDKRCAVIRGVKHLSGAPVMASDLRAGASLVIAGLIASGVTEISRVYHIDRGYDGLEKKLQGLGARITRVKQPKKLRSANTLPQQTRT